MHLVIFHYHLLPGGVTGVIDQMAAAISRFPGSVDSLEIVSGSAEGIEALRERWNVTVVPEIGYISRRRLADYAPVPATGKNAGEHGGGPIGQVAPQEVAEGAGVLADRVKAILLERWGGPDTTTFPSVAGTPTCATFTRRVSAISTRWPRTLPM